MTSPVHPCHRLDLHNQLLFWMCGFAWAILPAMTSGVTVALHVHTFTPTICLVKCSATVVDVSVLVVLRDWLIKTGVSQNNGFLFIKHQRAATFVNKTLLLF